MSPSSPRSTNRKKSDWTVVEMLEWATAYFEERSIPAPRLSIEWLLAHVLQVKRLDLYLKFDRPLSRLELDTLKPLVQRRALHEPLQYITGSTDFYNITLNVTSDVLIPRPETEQLVDMILKNHPDKEAVTVLDVGTGSGCIALALKKARPEWDITAIDISDDALAVARINAERASLDVAFHHGDLGTYRPDKKMDIIVSNPPYVHRHESEELERQVLEYEPVTALITDDPAGIYSGLLKLCRVAMAPDGTFYFEINESDGNDLVTLCRRELFDCRLHKDDARKPRFISGTF